MYRITASIRSIKFLVFTRINICVVFLCGVFLHLKVIINDRLIDT